MLSDAAKKDPAMSGQTDYERREGDFYATPPENVDCLLHYVDMTDEKVWEPAAGEGHISKRLSEFCKVTSTDLYDRGYCQGGVDFLKQDKISDITAIVTNPPFGDMAEKFIRHALELTKPVEGMVAMFLRNEYDMADKRIDLFENHPAYSRKICVTKRPRWIEGSKGSPRHNYAWYVWDWTHVEDYAGINYIHPRNARPQKPKKRIYEWLEKFGIELTDSISDEEKGELDTLIFRMDCDLPFSPNDQERMKELIEKNAKQQGE